MIKTSNNVTSSESPSLLWFCLTGSILRPCVMGGWLQQLFCLFRFNFRGKEHVPLYQHSQPMLGAPCLLLLVPVSIPEAIAVAELLSYPDSSGPGVKPHPGLQTASGRRRMLLVPPRIKGCRHEDMGSGGLGTMPARVHMLDGAPTAHCSEHLVPIFTHLPSKLPGAILMWRKKLKVELEATHLRTLLGRVQSAHQRAHRDSYHKGN